MSDRFVNWTWFGGHAFWGVICWAGSWERGVWWVGFGRARVILRAAWNEPLFSERYGFTNTWRIAKGWRLQTRMVKAND